MIHSLPFAELRAGQVKLGFWLTYPAPGILEVVHRDWDWFCLDSQHGQLEYATLVEGMRAADAVRVPTVIRVRDHSLGAIGPVLDTNCAGIIVPMVNTADDARRAVEQAKFPPLGQRSYGGRRAVDLGGPTYWASANEECSLIVQIETAQAVDNVAAILETPGVDAVFLGPADLRLSLGLPLDAPATHPEIHDRLARVAHAARAANKVAGSAGGTTPDSLRLLADLGYTLIAACSDVMVIRQTSPTLSAALRAAL